MAIDAPMTVRANAGARWRVAAWALCALLAFGVAQPAAQPQAPRALHVEAAFLVNFLRYTDWPRERLPDPATPFRIAVVGDDDAADTVRAVANAAGLVRGRRIEVERIAMPDGNARPEIQRLRDCHLVYLRDVPNDTQREVLRGVTGAPVLTVGDGRDFAQRGGMLGIVRADTRLAIEANPRVIEANGLLVSAKVLKLARIRSGGIR